MSVRKLLQWAGEGLAVDASVTIEDEDEGGEFLYIVCARGIERDDLLSVVYQGYDYDAAWAQFYDWKDRLSDL